jgi:acylphosphatase
MPVRYDMTFTGTVQGVGFRYTTVTVAQGYDVSGWVRNEPNGSVRCVVEGPKPELDRFVASVKQAMQGNINDVAIVQSNATGEFNGFTLRH